MELTRHILFGRLAAGPGTNVRRPGHRLPHVPNEGTPSRSSRRWQRAGLGWRRRVGGVEDLVVGEAVAHSDGFEIFANGILMPPGRSRTPRGRATPSGSPTPRPAAGHGRGRPGGRAEAVLSRAIASRNGDDLRRAARAPWRGGGMRSLITGGAGFIGSHLAEALLRQGGTVAVIDDLSTGSIENIEHLKGHAGVLLRHRHDPEPPAHGRARRRRRRRLPPGGRGRRAADHREARPDDRDQHQGHGARPRARRQEAQARRGGLHQRGLRQGQRAAVQRGHDLVLGATTKSRWSYACSKAIDEFLALAYWREKQGARRHRAASSTRWARGRRAATGWSSPTSSSRPWRASPITVFGDGKQSRCFTWVGDAVTRGHRAHRSIPRPWARCSTSGRDQEVTIARARAARSSR